MNIEKTPPDRAGSFYMADTKVSLPRSWDIHFHSPPCHLWI